MTTLTKEPENIKRFKQEIEAGNEKITGISFTCLIKDVKENTTKTDSIYLDMLCSDKTGEVMIRKWSATKIDMEIYKKGTVVSFQNLDKNIYQGKFQGFIVGKNTKVEIRNDLNSLDYKVSIIPAENILVSKLESYIEMITEPSYNTVIEELFNNTDQKEKFLNGAGGESVHHDDKHGLLLHTVAMLDAANALTDVYNNLINANLNKELIITAIICHDWFKTVEYTFDENWLASHNEYCVLEGHVFRGAAFIQKLIDEEKIDKELGKLLTHCILAHHGKLEWGSPVKPSIPEAFIVHTVDNMDARMYTFVYQSRLLCDGEISNKMFNLENTQIYKPLYYTED